ncbi:methyltransferase family protein [Agrilutibacter solisilvae]|uniref:Isoprenylcysteine carboxylmethyltransferase family protein n=1 Tax=Agrilutibacter solisilvae TaxID=2763317 RepID=A0A975AS33_9GAMM|nr:isoprenylcysteine carboxylmethyltransferase family protein [Lysobacter solisilvae]QSX78352.1 isoprenylcysteine carboxylmethyltransferase family protein [Lysobacter solisilvae]
MFSALETRVPPPFLFLTLATIVWALPGSIYSPVHTAIGVPALLLGLSINAWPKSLFRRAGTTVNPLHPERSSVLITSGLYRYSRNPMYLGYALALLGWVICQGKLLGLGAVAIFIGYVTRFQILPEERQLSARFPAEYAAYKRAVRRWA